MSVHAGPSSARRTQEQCSRMPVARRGLTATRRAGEYRRERLVPNRARPERPLGPAGRRSVQSRTSARSLCVRSYRRSGRPRRADARATRHTPGPALRSDQYQSARPERTRIPANSWEAIDKSNVPFQDDDCWPVAGDSSRHDKSKHPVNNPPDFFRCSRQD